MTKCQVCEVELTRKNWGITRKTFPSGSRWGRCYKHWRCDDCGTRTEQGSGFSPVIYRDGCYCDACFKKRLDVRVAAFEGDTSYTKEITCPWCGYEFSDSWEYSDYGEMECGECERIFFLERVVDVTYSTKKVKQNEKTS